MCFYFIFSSEKCTNNLIKLDEILLERQHKNNIWESVDKNKQQGDDIKMKTQQQTDESKDIESSDIECDVLEEEIFTSTDDPVHIQIYICMIIYQNH